MESSKYITNVTAAAERFRVNVNRAFDLFANGNPHQLRNAIERAIVMYDQELLNLDKRTARKG